MESIIKSFMGIFFMMLLTFLGLGLLSAAIDTRNAELYASNVAQMIRCGNYAEDLVTLCEEEAKADGYIVDARVYRSEDGYRKYGVLTLDYEYEIPFLRLMEAKTIQMEF